MKTKRKYIDHIRLDLGLKSDGHDSYLLEGKPVYVAGNRSRKMCYAIDSAVMDTQSGYLKIIGWAGICDSRLRDQKICAFLLSGEQEIPLTAYQLKRPDVKEAHPEINSNYPGFCMVADLVHLQEGSQLNIAIENSGSFYRVPYKGEAVMSQQELSQKIGLMEKYDKDETKDKWFQVGQSFFLNEDLSLLDGDPYSDRYRQQQLDLYCALTNKDNYDSSESEFIPLDVAYHADPRPYPCCTGQLDHIGNNLLQVGHIFKSLDLPAGSSVLEYGPGGGFVTMLLAASGIEMTVVDINPDCIKVIERMAEDRGLKVEAMVGEFGDAPDKNRKYDAILFFESFHHCLNFEEVMMGLHRHLTDGGKIVFAGEPIMDDYPKPWGLRLDGQSVYEIINKGWLEMGFSEEFFRAMLERCGWKVEKQEFKGGIPPTFIARNKKRRPGGAPLR